MREHDLSSAEQIPGELLARLTRFGRVYLLDTVTSTNDYAFTLADKREPAVVIARHQTRGRGRFRRPWYADSDSLTFSVLLFQQLAETEEPVPVAQVTQLTGLALCRAIEDITGLEPLIRWPNDIMLNNRKIAGILCEQRKDAVAVGIGLNVNQTEFPEDLPEAGSLCLAGGRILEKLELLEKILGHLFTFLRQAREGEQTQLLAAIKNRSAVLHRRVEIRTLFRRHIGTVVDLDAEGRIVLRTTSGRLAIINSGQARRLR